MPVKCPECSSTNITKEDVYEDFMAYTQVLFEGAWTWKWVGGPDGIADGDPVRTIFTCQDCEHENGLW